MFGFDGSGCVQYVFMDGSIIIEYHGFLLSTLQTSFLLKKEYNEFKLLQSVLDEKFKFLLIALTSSTIALSSIT